MQKTYQERLIVRGAECDMFRRMRMDAVFMAMQEGGERHAKMLGLGHDAMLAKGFFFVLSRTHVQVSRMPQCGETIVHTTWPGTSNKFFCPRFHTFTTEDGTPLLSAGALWVLLDTVNRRIVSPTKIDLGFPDNSDIPDAVPLPNRLPRVGENASLCSRTPVFCEFDINGHVNNTKYVAWILDTLGAQALDGRFIRDLTVSYEKEIREIAPLTLALSREEDAFTFQVLSESGMKHFSAFGSLAKEE
ncbi:MAG: hypothetical protein IKV90_09305 [Clostridia bacterium]|nr:hypothetical protein [Clostridia bacterium]